MNRLRLATFPALLLALAGSPLAAQPELRPGMPVNEARELIESLRPTNAALVYYRTWMTANARLDEVHFALNDIEDDDTLTTLTPEEAQQLLIDEHKVIETYLEAAALERCDFGIAYQDGWYAVLPHLGKLRATARLLAVDARRLLDAGDADAAAERAAAIYGMGWQVAGDRVLISSLVGLAIVHTGHELTEALIDSGELGEQDRDDLIARLERFETSEDPFRVRTCIAMEGAMTAGWLDRLFGETRLGNRLFEDGFLVGDDTGMRGQLNALDAEGIRVEAARMSEYYQRVIDVWNDEDAVAKIDALAAIVEAGGFGPLSKAFGASLGRAREGEQRGLGELLDTLDALRAYKPEGDDDPKPESEATEATPKQ